MPDIIQLLPDHIANQIAAGEVIQRPASVVKELLENAIDASSDTIHLIIKDAGKTLIQVVDNGIGMSESDARLSLERHATSKLSTASDLNAIKTMGFRGEALASIAAISHLELKTRTKENQVGTCVKVEGSEIKSQEFCQASIGTSVSVKHLFFNVPARRKFLKSDNVELKHIIQEFQHVALAWPSIEFNLHHNNEEVYHLLAGNLKQRVTHVLGNKFKNGLVPISEHTDLINLTGFVGKPDLARKQRGNQYFFVNSRFIKDFYLSHAIKLAFDQLIPEDYYPAYVIYIDVDPNFIDVNVHPTKQEIKFEDQRIVYQYLKTSIRHALGQYHISPTLDFDNDGGLLGRELAIHVSTQEQSRQTHPAEGGNTRHASTPSQKQDDWDMYFNKIKDAQSQIEEKNNVITLGSNMNCEAQEQLTMRNFQFNASYIVTQIKSGIIIIDQHYAHVRILYEEYLTHLKNQAAYKEQLMFPQTLELDPGQSAILNEMLDTLNEMGFEISSFGADTYIIQSCPPNVQKYKEPKEIIIDLVQDASEDKPINSGIEERIAFLLAKNSAINKGKKLNDLEMNNLIGKLFACEMPLKTPNGKKCFVAFDKDKIANLFNSKL